MKVWGFVLVFYLLVENVVNPICSSFCFSRKVINNVPVIFNKNIKIQFFNDVLFVKMWLLVLSVVDDVGEHVLFIKDFHPTVDVRLHEAEASGYHICLNYFVFDQFFDISPARRWEDARKVEKIPKYLFWFGLWDVKSLFPFWDESVFEACHKRTNYPCRIVE